MKILHVMAGAENGGAEMACVDMCLAMHEAGEDIEVVTRANPVRVPMLEKAGIRVHILPFGGAVDVYTPWALGQIIRKTQPLIVQTWLARAAKKTPNWAQIKIRQRYLVVSRLGGYYKKKNFRSTDYFTTITPDIKRHLVDNGFAADKIRHINNFAETENAAAPADRAALDTPLDASVLLTLSRYHTSKALDILIRALVDLPGVYAWLAGDGPERSVLEKLAQDLGVADRVRFLGWRTDRAALLQAADICIFTSRYEPFGTVFVQAWQQKRPVIVSDADGPSQFCTHEKDSLIVPRDDVPALAAAVKRLQNDTALRDRLVQNGWENYRENFTKDKSVQAYLEYYIEILGREGILG